MVYEILWSADASDELMEIVTFQKDRYGIQKAAEVYKRIHDRVLVVKTLPETGREVPELTAIGVTEIHELVESPWRILYEVSGGRVEILSVIDGRRNLEEILYRKVMDGKLI